MLVGLAAMAAGIWAGSAHADVTSPFSIAVLPDTQYYAAQINGGTAQMFYTQTQWIADNRVSKKIAFLAGVGDIVDTEGSDAQWTIADTAYDTIDAIQAGAFPYSAPAGNHDVIPNTGRFAANFGNSRYAGRSWYGGASPDGLNFYQYFNGGGQQFLSIGVNYQADAAARNWVKGILAANPNVPTIISTHDYLNIETATVGSATRSTYGQTLWDDVVKTNNQVFMVLAGHNPGTGRRISTNLYGNTVHEILVDYQAQTNGGNGFMRLMEFNPATNTVHTSSFAPISGGTKTGAADEFDITINFAARFAPVNFTLSSKTFQNGVNSYNGTRDTYVSASTSSANTSFAATTPVIIDTDDGGVTNTHAQALIKFGNIFTDEGGTVPRGATITQATLTITTGSSANDNTNATLEIREVTRTWVDSDTWNTLGGGIGAGEYNPTVISSLAGSAQSAKATFDVTASLQAWSAGGTNNGWVFLPTSTDAWRWNSSEFGTFASRPELSITYQVALVPEPGSLGVLGIGIGALLWRKRRPEGGG